MGAESSVLQDCEIAELVHHYDNENWGLHDAVSKDGQDLSIFSYKRKEKKEIDLLQINSQYLKTLRHPNILHYVSSGKGEEGSYLLTERVIPLELELSSLSSYEIIAGLHDVIEAVGFLHDNVRICHNNINLSAIFITTDRKWKLGGLEHACPFDEVTPAFLESHQAYRSEDAIAPEEKASHYKVAADTEHVRDVYAVGVLTDFFLELMGDIGDITKTFDVIIRDECMNSDPSERPNLSTVLQNKIFRNDFIEIQQFLRKISIKTKQEKEDFFRLVLSKLIGLPEKLVARQLVKPLLSRFVLLDDTAVAYMVPHLLTPCRDERRPTMCRKGEITPVFTVPVFRSYVIPEVFKIFHVHDSCIRIVLLKTFASYVDLFDKNMLKTTILPQILLGLYDTKDELVTASLRALADIVPILSADVVIGGQRKPLFTAGIPKDTSASVKSVSKVLGKRNKTLLKDLAVGRFSSSNGGLPPDTSNQGCDPEKEAKQREKEQRREDAKRKREERRREMKEKKALASDRNATEEDNRIVHGFPEDSVEEADVINIRVSQGETTRDNWEEKSEEEWESWENLDQSENSDSYSNKHINNGSHDVSEGSISDEIENELKNMPTTVSPKSPRSISGLTFQTKSKTRIKSSDDEAEWPLQSSPNRTSNFKNDANKKKIKSTGALKISLNEKLDSETKLGNSEPSSGFRDNRQRIDVRNNDRPKAKLKQQQQPKTVAKESLPLGAEFDIMEIKVKKISHPASVEPDFFADMLPEIAHRPTQIVLSPSPTPKAQTPDRKFSTGNTKKLMSFAVTETEDSEGWGNEDLDWGGDF